MKNSIVVVLILCVMFVGSLVNAVKPTRLQLIALGVGVLGIGAYGIYRFSPQYLEKKAVDTLCIALKPSDKCTPDEQREQAKLICRARRIAAILKEKGHAVKGKSIELFLDASDIRRGQKAISWDEPLVALEKLVTLEKKPNPFEKEESEKADRFGYAQWNSFIDTSIVKKILAKESPEKQAKNIENINKIVDAVEQRHCAPASRIKHLRQALFLVDLFA